MQEATIVPPALVPAPQPMEPAAVSVGPEGVVRGEAFSRLQSVLVSCSIGWASPQAPE
jgi:hypothetical protein